MELVYTPEEVERPDDVSAWTKRLKYTTVAELISDYEAHNASIGRTHCPVLDTLRRRVNDPIDEVEDDVYGHRIIGPIALAETMWATRAFNNQGTHPHGNYIQGWAQHHCAARLVKHNWEDARYAVSEMLKEPKMQFASPEAQALIRDYFVGHHPNPDNFFAKYPGAAKLLGLGVDP